MLSHHASDPRAPRRGRAGLIVLLILLAAVGVGVFMIVGDRRAGGPGGPGGPGGSDAGGPVTDQRRADQLARELAAAYFADDDRAQAAAAIAPLVERDDPSAQDLVSAAAIQLRTADVDGARVYLDQAAELDPASPRVRYNQARLERWEGNYAGAVEHLEAVVEALPEDLPAQLMLGDTYENVDRVEEAAAIYERLLARGVDANGAWHMTALYRMSLIARDDGRADASAELRAEFELLNGRGISPPDGSQLDIGVLGGIPVPPPLDTVPSGTGRLPEFGGAVAGAALPDAERALLADLDNNGRLDLVGYGEAGVTVAFGYETGWEHAMLSETSFDGLVAFDFGNDDDLDLLGWSGTRLELLVADGAETESGYAWRPRGELFDELGASLSGPIAGVTAVDYDHEGDLDLILVGPFGVRVLRDDGAAGVDGRYTDATAEAGLTGVASAAWCVIEDFDTDQDVDLLFGPDLFLASNLRGGRFEDVAAERFDAPPGWTTAPVAADLDGEGRPDLIGTVDGGYDVWFGSPSGRFVPEGRVRPAPGPVAEALAHDLDLDGSLDLVWGTAAGLAGTLAPGLEVEQAFELTLASAGEGGPAALGDVEGDRAWDLAWRGPSGIALHPSTPKNSAVRLGFRGAKDNRRGVGAVVEVRSGPIYRRLFWKGEAELVGVGERTEMDLVRVTWPNGVVQYDDRRELGDRAATGDTLGFLQSEGLVGSCPFLYTWNGATFEFISDVLGITPLGLPMAPGLLVPPDHDEYVLVLGEQLRARDGFLDLQFTEELREVTYLDRVRLDVVDHPAGSEIYPDERFTFPPFPGEHTHAVVDPLLPVAALDPEGNDWADELAAIDARYSVPFEPISTQIQGIANHHWLELSFDPERIRQAERLRLVMTGWLYWSNASVNMAIARDPRYEFLPPMIQVPDGEGGWRDTGPPVGFPAGKTKSMVIDVTELLDRDDPRVRVVSTLRLYWDSIRLAVDADDAELRVTSLEPATAKLWRRGFSEPVEHERPHQPETFEWDRVSVIPRWNPHPGLYTRLGETLPLVTAVDDRFVIMASGDALHVRFDATKLPPVPEGWRRDYLVYLDGWAKDRDPNTHEALNVEPLPFHGMSGYPYGPDEAFPDTPEHRAWRKEWNTRLPEAWLPRVAGTGRGGL